MVAPPNHRYGNGRYSAKKMAKPVNFIFLAPEAREVCVVGDFNEWNPGAHPMNRQVDGSWTTQVPLTHGHHRYHFLVDGSVVLDPRANGVVRDQQNKQVSLIAVS